MKQNEQHWCTFLGENIYYKQKPPRKNEDEHFQLLYYFSYVIKSGIRGFPNP